METSIDKDSAAEF